MRIGLSTSVIQRGKTGIAQYLFALLRALIPLAGRHDFVLYVLEEDLPLFAFVREAMHLVPVAERHRPAVRNILWHQRVLPRLAREHGLDVLHVPSYRRLLWPRPCPLVATIHDLAPFRLAGKYDWKRMFYGRVVVRQLAHRQDEIITVSQQTAQDVETFFGVPPDRLTVIHNGVDHERFHPGQPAEAREDIGRRRGLDRPFLLYVARLEHPAKNHVRLIAAYDELKRQTGSDWLLVFGGTDWHGAGAIHAAVRASPYANDIRPLGFVPDAELPQLYRAATAFVYPSLFEGFGLPPIEAMACGCPVVCSRRGSLGEVVGDAALIVEPEDVADMARGLVEICSQPARRTVLRAAGLMRAAGFRWETAAAQTLSVYERAANRLQK